MCILCLSDEVFIERIFNNSNWSIYDWHKHTVFIAHSIYWFIRQACQSRSQISSIISVFEPPPFKKKNTQNLKKKPAQHPPRLEETYMYICIKIESKQKTFLDIFM